MDAGSTSKSEKQASLRKTAHLLLYSSLILSTPDTSSVSGFSLGAAHLLTSNFGMMAPDMTKLHGPAHINPPAIVRPYNPPSQKQIYIPTTQLRDDLIKYEK